MDNQENRVEGVCPTPKEKTSKNAPVDPETFFANWRDAMVSEKDPVPKLRSLVRKGFNGETTPSHVSQLVASLAEHSIVAERLAVSLAVQERFGKLKPLAHQFLGQLRAAFAEAIHYDQAEFCGYRAQHAVEEWVAERAPSAPASERDSWFRRFATCLLKDSEQKTLLVGLVAASRRWAASKGLKSSRPEAAFVRGIALAIGGPIVGANRLELILAGVSAVDEQYRQVLNRELSLERQIRTQQDDIGALNRHVSALEATISAERTAGEQKNARIGELEGSLEQAKVRYDLLDRHWRGVSEQELTKQSGTFKERVSQEVVEALLALDRESPNLEIALRRLRRIQEILSKS